MLTFTEVCFHDMDATRDIITREAGFGYLKSKQLVSGESGFFEHWPLAFARRSSAMGKEKAGAALLPRLNLP
jgi:hypothetical protein